MINRYFAVAAIIANALMVSAAGAETFTIRCERQASYGGDGAAVMTSNRLCQPPHSLP